MMLLVFLAGCATTADSLSESPAYEAGKTYLDEDGLPVYMCSPPADDSYIFSMPFHVSHGYMDVDGFSIMGDPKTWIQPLQGVDSHYYYWRSDDTLFEYETTLTIGLYASGLEHPIQAQGEQVLDNLDTVYGGDPSVHTSGDIIWGDTRRFGTDRSDSEFYFSPSGFCLSRIRNQRVQGFYSYRPDPESPGAAFRAAFNVTYYFDLQANEPAESADPDHEYAFWGTDVGEFLHVRNLGSFYWSNADGVDPDTLWSADAVPDGEEE